MDFESDVMPVMQQKLEYFRKIRDGVYLTKCWSCGDSADPKHRHMYLFPEGNRCGYYCHKCGAKGSITPDILYQLIGPNTFQEQISNKIVRRISPGNPNVQIETDIPARNSSQYQYIRWRLGANFTPEELLRFRIIVDQQAFIDKYNIKNILPIRNTVLFLSADSNILLFRNMTENDEFRWIKKKVYAKYDSCPYAIKGGFDVFDTNPQTIILAEGIFDILGIYAHITKGANLYAAVLGKKYSSAIQWLIRKGIFGKNIDIQIYSDDDIPVRDIRQDLRKYRWMYGRISVRYNDAGHDFGVHADEIVLRDPVYV